MQRFQNDTLKEIVYRLTARKTLDCKDRTPKINDTAGYGALVEPIAFAIATTRAASNAYTTRELTDEYNGKGNWLEDRVQKAVEARATVDTVNGVTHLKMTKEAAKKIFPEANDEVLERFVDDYALWEKAYDTSPDLSSLCVK
jgi:hypothetical protein